MKKWRGSLNKCVYQKARTEKKKKKVMDEFLLFQSRTSIGQPFFMWTVYRVWEGGVLESCSWMAIGRGPTVFCFVFFVAATIVRRQFLCVTPVWVYDGKWWNLILFILYCVSVTVLCVLARCVWILVVGTYSRKSWQTLWMNMYIGKGVSYSLLW